MLKQRFGKITLILFVGLCTIQLTGCSKKTAPSSTDKTIKRKKTRCNCGKNKKIALDNYHFKNQNISYLG